MLLDVKKDELKQRSFNLRAEPLSSLFPFPLVFYLERSWIHLVLYSKVHLFSWKEENTKCLQSS